MESSQEENQIILPKVSLPQNNEKQPRNDQSPLEEKVCYREKMSHEPEFKL